MAIFKLGKRIGPFDISGGISRGDFKTSAMHKTDSDPRLKMQANTENTIGRFRSAINASEGFARQNRFAIRIFPPTNLEKEIATASSAKYLEGQVIPPFQSGYVPAHDFDEPVTGKYMNDLMQTYGRQVNIMCDSVSMPQKSMETQEVQYGSEPKRSMVQTHTFDGQISASFYADKYLRERQFMESWMKMCVGEHTHKANYYDNYVGKMHIYQLGSDNESSRDMPTYAVEAMEVYPAQIGAIEYNYGTNNQVTKINMQFNYKYWRNMGSETSSLSFGQTNQTPADVKAKNTGLFGKLPPALQRAGRNVFGQARTVMNPIGKIFKGKVFPPFT
jgi:hypothetical protein